MIYIINKHGSLLYPANDKHIRQASAFYVMCQISKLLSPIANSSEFKELEFEKLMIYNYTTPTFLKFVIITDKTQSKENVKYMFNTIYKLYCDYALKNPFYQLDDPINCSKFLKHIKLLEDKL